MNSLQIGSTLVNKTTTQISPLFMKTLIECYLFRKEARNKVVHNRRFYKHLLKVFKWQKRIRNEINHDKNNNANNNTNNSSGSDSSNKSTSGSNESNGSPQSISASSLSNEPMNFDTINDLMTTNQVPKIDNFDNVNNDQKIVSSKTTKRQTKRPPSKKSAPPKKGSSSIAKSIVGRQENKNFLGASSCSNSSSRCSISSASSFGSSASSDGNIKVINSNSNSKIDNLDQRIVTEKEDGCLDSHMDIVRRNLWQMIVRKDIVQAHKKMVSFEELKLNQTKTIAHRCQSHFMEFQRLNNKLKQKQQLEEQKS